VPLQAGPAILPTVEFFELPEPPPGLSEARRHRRIRPGWFGPPENVAPGVVLLELVLVNTGDVALYLNTVLAYPTGFELRLDTRARLESDDEDEDAPDPLGSYWRMSGRRLRRNSREIPPEVLRFGVEFSDGSKVTNIASEHAFFPEAKESDARPESAPRLVNQGGGGGGGSWHDAYWVHPLPPPGKLAFVCEWPQQQIELTKTVIEADTILAAAARARELWRLPELPERSDDDDPPMLST